MKYLLLFYFDPNITPLQTLSIADSPYVVQALCLLAFISQRVHVPKQHTSLEVLA